MTIELAAHGTYIAGYSPNVYDREAIPIARINYASRVECEAMLSVSASPASENNMNESCILRSTNKYVIYILEVDGALKVFVHQEKDGIEQRPRGYIGGSNYLSYSLSKG